MKNKTVTNIGLRLKTNFGNIKDALNKASNQGYNYLLTEVSSRSQVNEQLVNTSNGLNKPFAYSELALTSDEWRHGTVGIITNLNDELKLADKNCTFDSGNGKNETKLYKISEILNKQLEYCRYVYMSAAVLELCEGMEYVHLANIVIGFMRGIETKISMNLWIRLPMNGGANKDTETEDYEWQGKKRPWKEDPWQVWNQFRGLCEYDRYISPVLELEEDVPAPDIVDRWLGEPVKALFVSTDIFMTNAEGFPVLSKPHQEVIKKFFKIGAQVVVEMEKPIPIMNMFSAYIRHIEKVAEQEVTKDSECGGIEEYVSGFEDNLQIPLQPLRDHLPGSTYEVFEKDPIKYVLYENAVYQALIERYPQPTDAKIVIIVVGAGRGPLVTRSLAAAERANMLVHVYAVEKNEFATNTLQHQRLSVWQDKVTVIHGDMREVNPPEKADIMVSELLGSFSDNELSPECLDGAQKFLKPDGIMIPKSYTSYIAPVMSIKYYNDICGMSQARKCGESLHVVYMNNKYIIAKPQKLFTYTHPNFCKNHTNDRSASREFISLQDCVLTGFAGYFESVLYGDITMSILPSTHTPGMFSWFSMFIPIREPVNVKKDEKIVSHYWRKSSKTGVWYEWSISSPKSVGIHNSGGRSSIISLN